MKSNSHAIKKKFNQIKTYLSLQKNRLKESLPLVYWALRKKQTPLLPKLVGLLTLAYALSPIDLIPDFIPVLGYLDDVILLPLMVKLTLSLIPKDIIALCRSEIRQDFSIKDYKKWYYALPIILIWILIIRALLKGLLTLI